MLLQHNQQCCVEDGGETILSVHVMPDLVGKGSGSGRDVCVCVCVWSVACADEHDEEEDHSDDHHGREEEDEAGEDGVGHGKDLLGLRGNHVGHGQHEAQAPTQAGALHLQRERRVRSCGGGGGCGC